MRKILLQNDIGIPLSPYPITIVKNHTAVLQALKEQVFDLVIVQELETLKIAKSLAPRTPIALLTPLGSIQQAIEAIRMGAIDYFIQPITMEMIHQVLVPQPLQDNTMESIVTQTAVMQKVLADIAKVAQSHAAVLINGESGTGKEVVAHAIHYQSPRAKHPFVKVNCAAIPESLIESEFFGHEKGAFTGAIDRRSGRFELAHRGTLLLDEISEIPINLQAKLLRVVQEQEFERVGGSKSIKVDVRLIATSNRNMREMIEKKLFREDLYFRLNVVPIQLPPLRERKEDILILANYFLKHFCKENHHPQKQLSCEAEQQLLQYPWPGNIRELANTIERAVVMSSATRVEVDHLQLDPGQPAFLFTPVIKGGTLAEVEKRHIIETLAHHKHNRTKAARTLGISIRTLRNKLLSYHH